MIEFDFDDVIVDCQTIVEAGLLEKTGIDVGPQRTKTFYVTIPGYTNEEIGNLVHEILLRDTYKMKPTELAIESLEEIYNITKKPIRIITARRLGLKGVTEKLMKSLVKERFKYQFVFSHGHKKSAFLKPTTRFFVDDLLDHINDLSESLDNVFIVTRDWNKNATLKSNVIRVENLQSVSRFIKKFL